MCERNRNTQEKIERRNKEKRDHRDLMITNRTISI